jgi:hypothetical protein
MKISEIFTAALSIIGIAISGLALYFSYASNRAELLAAPLPARTHVLCQKAAKSWFMIAYVPFSIYNRGGRGSSIVKIEPSSLVESLTATTHGSDSFKALPHYTYVDESIGKDPRSLELLRWEDGNPNLRLVEPVTPQAFSQSPTLFNIQVPSGETKLVTLVFRSDLSLNESGISDVHAELIATLSDGQRLPLQATFHAPSVGRGRCA